MKNMSGGIQKLDPRIMAKTPTWRDFLLTYIILLVCIGGQLLIYNSYLPINQLPKKYFFTIFGYWAAVSFLIMFVIRFIIRKIYEKPMKMLSEATKKVAAGDFSVCLEPLHSNNKMDYIDVMFEDFNTMVKELDSIETLKSDFISNISHEIKTPLAVIQNYASMLQKENLSAEKQHEYINTIISASQNLTVLVTNILKLSKLENLQIIPQPGSYDLCRQLCDCALEFEDRWEEKNIDFAADIEDSLIINADETMLEIVWNNLLSNAIKFTEPGGKINFTEHHNEKQVIVTVSDTGCGMDRNTIKHIFDKFYQGNTLHSKEGNGLGLALCKKVIELSNGQITVQSELGKGSTFNVILNL